MPRKYIDHMCSQLGMAHLVHGRTDRECYELWVNMVGEHPALLDLKAHIAATLPFISIDQLLSRKEQLALWDTLAEFKTRFT